MTLGVVALNTHMHTRITCILSRIETNIRLKTVRACVCVCVCVCVCTSVSAQAVKDVSHLSYVSSEAMCVGLSV
jgi:hypothetical protein